MSVSKRWLNYHLNWFSGVICSFMITFFQNILNFFFCQTTQLNWIIEIHYNTQLLAWSIKSNEKSGFKSHTRYDQKHLLENISNYHPFSILEHFWPCSLTAPPNRRLSQRPRHLGHLQTDTRLKEWWIIGKWALKRTLTLSRRFARISFPWERVQLRS